MPASSRSLSSGSALARVRPSSHSDCSPTERSSAASSFRPSTLLREESPGESCLRPRSWSSLLTPTPVDVLRGYLYTWLLVAADQSVKSSTRIRSIPQFGASSHLQVRRSLADEPFTSVALFSALGSGYLVRYTRRLKPIIFVGMAIEVLGIGLMIKFRTSQTPVRDLIGIQIVRGIGAGMVSFPNQAGSSDCPSCSVFRCTQLTSTLC